MMSERNAEPELNNPIEVHSFDPSIFCEVSQDTVAVSDVAINVQKLRFSTPKINIKSFSFSATDCVKTASETSPRDPFQARKPRGLSAKKQKSIAAQSRTRIPPPKDLIKLEDRLFYLLQPPLESLLSTEQLTFKFEPFPHQYEGVAFLYPRHAAILADEMGLGKTMQAVTAIRMLLHQQELKSILLICPKPLVTNWQREFELWAPEIPCTFIGGNKAKRIWQWQDVDSPVKIANYELVLRDAAIIHEANLQFDLVVLDEAQRIKNCSSSTSKTVQSIPRERSWALTGTPIENSAEDLVGIFEFLNSGLINSSMSPRTMASEVKDFIIRRTKDAVLDDMPPKLIKDANVDLTDDQRSTYLEAEEDGVVRLNELGHTLSVQHVFELVLRLKQICNFDPVTGASQKLDWLKADMEEIAASGRKAIVFSQWVKTIDKIKEGLAEYNPLEYHGKIPSAKRDDILRRFKEDKKHSVILMSYGAGAVGLNLQFCRYVYLFDRWWNPAVEDQAINRAHRLGSAGSVTVTRFVTTQTIEERINEVLEQKRELFETMIGGATNVKRGLSKSEIFGLFNIPKPKQKAA